MKVWIFVVILVLGAAGRGAAADEVMDVPTRDGVTVRLALTIPASPSAVAVLFAGGHGTLEIGDDGTIARDGNALIRRRQAFADQGLVAAAIDAPSDQFAENGKMADGFRESAAHVADIRAVVAALRNRFAVPVWLVGTSRGSTSVAHAAIELTDGRLDGIVLTSSIGVDHRRGGNLLNMELARISVPALVVHHEDDNCAVTPFAGAVEIAARLTGAPASELMRITGGKRGSKVCGPVSHHGFRGQRGKVFAAIADWFKSH